MRAKRNFNIKLLICCLVVVLLGTVLVACNKYVPDSYDYLVTFCYNLGTEISGNAPDVYLGVRDPDKEHGVGALVGIHPGYNDSTFSEAAITGYYLEGWYCAKLDADGKPIVDKTTGRVELVDEKFDFQEDRIHEDTTLYAKLVKSPRMLFVDADTGDVVSEINGRKPGERRYKPTASLTPQKEVDGEPYTFMGNYYADRECTQEFEFPYTFGNDDVNVYCKFIKGDWVLVSTVSEFSGAIVNGRNIYLMNDLDFAGQSYVPRNYNSEINGNGHKISNIKISKTGNDIIDRFVNGTNLGIFQTLMGRSYIHDVTFDNVTIEITTSSDFESILSVNIGFLAGQASDGARMENIKLSGQMTCNSYTYQAVSTNHIAIGTFVALNNAKADQIVNCDYSDVKLIYLS